MLIHMSFCPQHSMLLLSYQIAGSVVSIPAGHTGTCTEEHAESNLQHKKAASCIPDTKKQLLRELAFLFTRAILSAVSLKSTHFVVLDLARNSSISRIPML